MVRYHVEYKLHASLVQGCSQSLEVVESAEVLIDRVHICSPIAVIALRSFVLVDRSDPDGGDAKALQIVEMFRDASQITAMPAARLGPFGWAVVVGGVAVREPVRHDQVHHILRGETGEAVPWIMPLREGIRYGDVSAVVIGNDLDCLGRSWLWA